MTKEQVISLQERIVKEITSTYNSIAEYKQHTSKKASNNKLLDHSTAERRIQIVEHKLKALKMMLAKIDNREHDFCMKCHQSILPNTSTRRSKNRLCATCA